MDRPGLDAWAALVDDKTGFAGMRIEYPPDVAPDSDGIEVGTKGSNAFFKLQDKNQRDRAVMQLGQDEAVTFNALDRSGAVTRHVVLSPPVK